MSLSTIEQLQLEETILPSPYSGELTELAESAFSYRFEAKNEPHIAELYHSNSKLNPHSTLKPAGQKKLSEVRQWFFEKAWRLQPDDLTAEAEGSILIKWENLPEGLRTLLDPLTQQDSPPSQLLYAVDLMVLTEQYLLRAIPWRGFLWIERQFEDEDWDKLREAVLDISLPHSPVLFLVACPWRHMLLVGPRGYRDTLIDAGKLINGLENIAYEQGMKLEMSTLFYDENIDKLLLLDGIERATVAIAVLKEN
jgi:hypothetical protein